MYRSLTKAGAEARNSSGGTWPKYRQNTVTETIESAASTITQRPRKGTKKIRPSVFPVFPQPTQGSPQDATSPTRTKSSSNTPSSIGEYVVTGRAPHRRPMSYHPQVSSDPSSARSFSSQNHPALESPERKHRSGSRPNSAQRHAKGFSMYEGHHPENYDILPPPRLGLHSTIVRGGVPMQTVYAHPVVTGSPPPVSPPGVPPPPYPEPSRMPPPDFLFRSSPDVDVDGSRSSTSSIPTSAQDLSRVSFPSVGSQGTQRAWAKNKRPSYPHRTSPFRPLGDSHRLVGQ